MPASGALRLTNMSGRGARAGTGTVPEMLVTEGVISNWADSPFDLRHRRLTLAGAVNEIVIPDEVAAALRDLRLPDTDCQRLVFRIRAHDGGAILAASEDELDELIGFVAAEANHEPNRRRQQRIDTAYDTLTAAQTRDGR